jgi:hypothetical protein
MGGGRSRFLPEAKDGKRADGRDLTAEWLKAPSAAYVTTDAELAALDPARTGPVLGLFANEHLPYEVERPVLGQGVPTLAAMATKAVDLLSKNPKGYFLLVEGGKIDMGSHLNNAKRTLTETVEFSKAIQAVLDKVNLDETLVIVTADHSHGLVISGYAAATPRSWAWRATRASRSWPATASPTRCSASPRAPAVRKAPTCAAIPPRKTPTTSTTTRTPRPSWAARPTRARTWACSPTARVLSGPWRGRGELPLPGHAPRLRLRRRRRSRGALADIAMRYHDTSSRNSLLPYKGLRSFLRAHC